MMLSLSNFVDDVKVFNKDTKITIDNGVRTLGAHETINLTVNKRSQQC